MKKGRELSFVFWTLVLLMVCVSQRYVSCRKRNSRHHRGKEDAQYRKATTISSIFSVGTTENACDSWWCGRGRECRRGIDGIPECICARECPEVGRVHDEGDFPDLDERDEKGAVCGTDGKIYPSRCELHRTACMENAPLSVDKSNKGCVHNANNHRGGLPPNDNQHRWTGFLGVDFEGEDSATEDVDSSEEYNSYDENGRKTFFEALPSTKSRMRGKKSFTDLNSSSSSMAHTSSSILVASGSNPKSDGKTLARPEIRRGSSLCSREEYEILKDALLVYNHERLIGDVPAKKFSREDDTIFTTTNRVKNSSNGWKVDKDYLLSLMFAHFDHNNNGALDYAELQKMGTEQKLGRPMLHCHLVDFLRFDDTDHDSLLSLNEFYTAFNKLYSMSIVAVEKPRPIIHLSGTVGENVEIKCDVAPSTESQSRLIIWHRYGVDVSNLISQGEEIRIFSDGTLFISTVQLLHAGNYTCHSKGNEKVSQAYMLSVQTMPDVKVRPHILWEKPGQEVTMECRVMGEPLPAVKWLKNDNPLPLELEDKYTVTGDGISLSVKDINFSDTGAYMCHAQNSAGKRIDISSLVVIDEQTLPPVQLNESQFLVFHDRGISAYDPTNCRLQHQILAADIIPGTERDYVCGSYSLSCVWGRAVRVSSSYVYVSQPRMDRILIISISQMVVVDVIATDSFPVELHYVPQVDQVWVECWRQEENSSEKTLQVIRNAKEKKKHHSLHPKPVDSQFDLIKDIFLPPDLLSSAQFWHGYITHKDARGLYKLDLRTLRYIKSIDLSSYNCLPENILFSALYGFIIAECKEPSSNRPTGQIVLDSMTDVVLDHKRDYIGEQYLSPDSRKLVTIVREADGTRLLLQAIKEYGLEFSFDVQTSLNVSDIAFVPSQRYHSYDLYASTVDKEDVLFVELETGKVELVPGVGKPLDYRSWKRPQRPISSKGLFSKYLVTPSNDAAFVLNGQSHTVNCEIGGLPKPNIIVWL